MKTLMLNISACKYLSWISQSWSVLCILFLVLLPLLQFSSYLCLSSTMSKSTISWHVTLIVKYLEEDVVQNEIIIIINNVEEFDILICNINCKICWGGWAPEWKSKKINQNWTLLRHEKNLRIKLHFCKIYEY